MTSRFWLFSSALVLGVSASAQTTIPEQLVPPLPKAPLPKAPLPEAPPTAIVPTPLDGAGKAQLELRSKRTFQLRLRYVNSSVMAFWLDPKNHAAPVELQNEAIIKKRGFREGDPLDIPSPLAPNSALPDGVERIIAVDPQNMLLVIGTSEGVARLQQIVELLDRPSRTLEFECNAFWLDALSPESASWASASVQLKSAGGADSDVLQTLVGKDRAARFPLLLMQIMGNPTLTATLPFAVDEDTPDRDTQRAFPGLKNGAEFDFRMPRLHGGVEIDPDMVMPNQPRLMILTERKTLRLTPIEDRTSPPTNAGNPLMLRVEVGRQSLFADISQAQTLLLHGSASAFGLKAPSPRFSVLVVRIVPRFTRAVQSATSLPGTFRF